MVVLIEKTKIVDIMMRSHYGQYWLVVFQNGHHRIVWTTGIEEEPGSKREYVAHIPFALYEDEQEEIARQVIDNNIWRYIEYCIGQDGDEVDNITYVRLAHSTEWLRDREKAASKSADEFLTQLNMPGKWDALWGFERIDGECYVRQPPFLIWWVEEVEVEE